MAGEASKGSQNLKPQINPEIPPSELGQLLRSTSLVSSSLSKLVRLGKELSSFRPFSRILTWGGIAAGTRR